MKKLSVLLTLISFAIILIFSCQKDKTSNPPVDNSGSSNSLKTTVSGIVLDESNAPLNGVTVIAYGQTTSTDQHGVFVLKNINANKDRCLIQFSKTGYFKRSHGFIAAGNTVNYVRIILISNAATQNFSSSTGGTISLPDGSSAAFQPNSFVNANGSAYTGTVNIAIKHLSPDDANFGFTIPGSDLLGKDVNNNDVALYTYGMLGVELTGSSGEALQLANGTTATLTLSIAASQLSSAPASIPLWHFDETTSLWKEEGAANKVGNNYVGTVTHFSWWNCDITIYMPRIKGKVIDCNGIPVGNILVTVNGWATTLTNQNGEWQGPVPTGTTFTVQVLASNNGQMVLNSQVENVPVLSNSQIYIVPDLIIPCPTRVAGVLKTCSGENTDGMVYIFDGNFFNFQFTTNGLFSMTAPENTQFQLEAFHSTTHYTQNIQTLFAPNILNVGGLLLCDTINLTNNTFILTGGPFTNQLFNINTSSSYASVTDTMGFAQTNISITGTSEPNITISYYYLNIMDTVPASTTCDVSISMTDTVNTYYIYGSNLSCNLTQVGVVGGQVKGSYYGVVVTSGNGSSSTGSISGTFDVPRIH